MAQPAVLIAWHFLESLCPKGFSELLIDYDYPTCSTSVIDTRIQGRCFAIATIIVSR